MRELRQRQPKKPDPDYLKWLRTQRCACGCLQGPPCDAAHLRARSYKYDKDSGWGRPDDKWALPLKHEHHMQQHHFHGGDELAWWKAHGVADPFALAIKYYQRYLRSKT
jgi:hypothetical protein